MKRKELIDGLSVSISRIHTDHPLRVAIDGVDAAGKTTLADELADALQRSGRSVIRASLDGFHHPEEIRYQLGETSPLGYYRDSFNHAALIELLLYPLGPDGSLLYKRLIFDFRQDGSIDAPFEQARTDQILLFDGVFLLRAELRPYWDFSIFVHADFEITVQRAMQRDLDLFGSAENVRKRYEKKYVPAQRMYLSEVEPERLADVVVNNNDPTQPA